MLACIFCKTACRIAVWSIAFFGLTEDWEVLSGPILEDMAFLTLLLRLFEEQGLRPSHTFSVPCRHSQVRSLYVFQSCKQSRLYFVFYSDEGESCVIFENLFVTCQCLPDFLYALHCNRLLGFLACDFVRTLAPILYTSKTTPWAISVPCA